MLNKITTDQLRDLFKDLENNYVFNIKVENKHPKKQELIELLNDVAECSPKISYIVNEGKSLKFTIYKNNISSHITFRCVPNGNEFPSLIMAILNCDGKGKNLPDEKTQSRIKAIKIPIHLKTYVNLTCLICSELVQMINALTIFNEQISHEIVDGGINKLEVIFLEIQNVPTVYANDALFQIGQSGIDEFINKLENKFNNLHNAKT